MTGSLATRLRAPAVRPPAAWSEFSRGRWFGLAGLALSLIGFYAALPPLELRTAVPSWLFCVAGAACAARALRAGEQRLGIAGLILAVGCAAGAYGAVHSGEGNLEYVVSWGALAAAMLRYATPLTFAALGGLVSERSGVVNIGLEGQLLSGAFFGALGADQTGSWVGGIVCAVLGGMLVAFVHAVFCVSLRADQIVVGTALNFVALGLTGYLYNDIYGADGTPPNLPAIPNLNLHIGSVGFFGPAVGDQNLMVWFGLLTVGIIYVLVFRTPMGLRLRAVGENPKAAETVGISVYRTRYLAVIASGGLAALGGAFLSIGFVNSFTENMSAGRGFIALAALIFGRWRPGGLLGATLLFGFSSALAQRLPRFDPSTATLFQALPYVLTLVAVAGVIGRSVPPAADGVPYKKGE